MHILSTSLSTYWSLCKSYRQTYFSKIKYCFKERLASSVLFISRCIPKLHILNNTYYLEGMHVMVNVNKIVTTRRFFFFFFFFFIIYP